MALDIRKGILSPVSCPCHSSSPSLKTSPAGIGERLMPHFDVTDMSWQRIAAASFFVLDQAIEIFTSGCT
jgi:hypothetical protein